MAPDRDSEIAAQRLDQWLCNARFAKSRNLAQALIARGKVRVNRERINKASQIVKAGDVITLSLGPRVRIIEVLGAALKRGPASVAAALYIELTPAPVRSTATPQPGEPGRAVREAGAGRPTKRDRRRIDRLTTDADDA